MAEKTKSLISRAKHAMFGYNATVDKGRRQAPTTRVRHESQELTQSKRKRLNATTLDQMRNHSIIAWMVRKHLDYVSSFHFSFRTEKGGLDSLVNRIFRWHGAPENMDFMGRLGRDEMFRLFEMEKVVNGDAALVKLAGLKLQAIESDLIAKGGCDDAEIANTINGSGLVVDDLGRVKKYAICTRNTGVTSGIKFHHLEDASCVIFDAYWTRLSSQFRGVSPLSTAINTVQDISEAMEMNIVKAKMQALFGVKIKRDSIGTDGDFGGAGGATDETADADTTATGSSFDLNPRAINILDLKPGDDADVIESRTPTAEFVEGMYLFIHVAMLALDIPITSFDSRRSSFSARIADLNEYEVSSESKRTKNRYVRKAYSDWVLKTIWNDSASAWPLKKVATENDMSLRDVQEAVEWIPAGSPWIDKLKQIKGDQLGISMLQDNSIDAARRRGQNVFENIDKQAKVIAYAKDRGVPLIIGTPPSSSVEEIVQEEIAAAKENESNG